MPDEEYAMGQNAGIHGSGAVWKSAAALFGLVLATYLALNLNKPPRALPESIPETEFSALRAVKHLAAISARPHSLGSAAHDGVLDAIVESWKTLGFEPEIQATTLIREQRAVAVNLQNILVRRQGTGSGEALMLATHYDSTESSYGAADAGSGVATLLETARAIKSGPPLKHDIIFLITDGEENGMLGAEAFVLEHPWAADVGLALNFEARGTSGPAWMFETSLGNSRLIKEFSRASLYPRANSLAVTIYRLMPNNSDLTVLMEAGMQGLNFAFIDSPLDYHTPMDNLAHLNLDSLQHHGSYALALARHFGNIGIPEKSAEDAVYFNIAGSLFIRYSRTASFILAFLSAALIIVAGVPGFKKKILRVKNLLRAVFFLPAALILIPALLVLLQKTISFSHGTWLPRGHYEYNPYYLLALILSALAVFLFLYHLFCSKAGWPNLAFAAGLIGALLTCGLVFYLPGASYLMGWPVLFLAGLLSFLFLSKKQGDNSWVKSALVILAFVPTVLIFTPLLYTFFMAMGLNLTGTIGLSVLLVLMFWMIIPLFDLLTQAGKKAWPLFAALGFLLFAAAGAMTSVPSVRHPLPSEMRYLMDYNAGRAFWFTRAGEWDEWKAMFISDPQPGYPLEKPEAGAPRLVHQETAVLTGDSPAVEKLEESEAEGVRTLRLKVYSSHRPEETFVNTLEGRVLSAEVNGKKIFEGSQEKQSLRFLFINPGQDGFELLLKVRSGRPLSLLVRERLLGLPEIPRHFLPQPPPKIMPLDESTILKKTFVY